MGSPCKCKACEAERAAGVLPPLEPRRDATPVKCGECKYGELTTVRPTPIKCHANPPTVTSSGDTEWAYTREADWCRIGVAK